MSPVSWYAPGRAHFAHDEDALAPVRLDRDGDLRVLQVAVRQPLLQLVLDRAQRQARRLDAADQREREGAVGFDRVLARQVRLVVDRDGQDVLRADRVVGLLREGGKHEQARGEQ